MKPKVLIFRTAGVNCHYETEYAFSLAGAEAEIKHINSLREVNFCDYQILCFPGGFSYGDYLGAGKVFSLEILLRFKEKILKFIEKGGLIIGICNGFQVLVRAGILPELCFQQKITLQENVSSKFEDRWVYLKVINPGIWLRGLPSVICLSVAHKEGRFFAPSSLINQLEENNQIVLKYVNEKGESASYPYNPNGSLGDVAGISSKCGKILGLMPHPERCVFLKQFPLLREGFFPFGLRIFQNGVNYFK